jgi:hypothetical protein
MIDVVKLNCVRFFHFVLLMKFSHSIQLNSTPEWREHYISYSKLKRIIYDTEKVKLIYARQLWA